MLDEQPAALRARFARGATCAAPSAAESARDQVAAAVLVALVPREQGMQIVLTRRTEHLRHHPGQISFPGGRIEASDASPVAAALREAGEEIGLAAEALEVLGCLPAYSTSTGFRVTPVVGLMDPLAPLRADPFEVAEIFEVPLRFVLDPANYQSHRIAWQGHEREVQAVPYQGYFIWGATAGMLHALARFLQAP